MSPSVVRALSQVCGAMMVCFAAAVNAGQSVDDLYEATVPVASRSDEDRHNAIGLALAAVVVKVSGGRDASASPVVTQAAMAPGRFVQQFQFLGNANSQDDPLRIRVRFDPFVVEALVRDAGLRLWGKQRPVLLVWMGFDGPEGRQLLSSDDHTGLASHLVTTARERGIPLLLPLMDLEDQMRVQPQDIWDGFSDKMALASERYGAEAVLVGRALATSAQAWEGRFELVLSNEVQAWSQSALAQDELLANAAHSAVDRMAQKLAGLVAGGDSEAVRLKVFDVRDVGSYARVLSYLKSLDTVESVLVTGLVADRLTVQLQTVGGASTLRQLVQIGVVMDLLPTSLDGGELHFRLRP